MDPITISGIAIFALILAFLPFGIMQNLEDGILVGQVSRVIDGDTFELTTGEKIRLALISAPERGQQGYHEARDMLVSLCHNTNAIIDLDNGQEKGSYGRLIGWVDRCNDNEDINKILIDENVTKVYEQFCKVSEFSDRLCVVGS